jgi:hypothetical protein
MSLRGADLRGIKPDFRIKRPPARPELFCNNKTVPFLSRTEEQLVPLKAVFADQGRRAGNGGKPAAHKRAALLNEAAAFAL